jgi:hypothetical protein
MNAAQLCCGSIVAAQRQAIPAHANSELTLIDGVQEIDRVRLKSEVSQWWERCALREKLLA